MSTYHSMFTRSSLSLFVLIVVAYGNRIAKGCIKACLTREFVQHLELHSVHAAYLIYVSYFGKEIGKEHCSVKPGA